MARQQRGPDKMECAVLVEVGEFEQMPEGAINALPCTKWLQRLNQCPCLIAHTAKEDGLGTSVVSFLPLFRLKDGKLGLGFVGGLLASFEDDQLPNEVVEGRPKVVNEFPYPDAPHPGARLPSGEIDEKIAGITLIISPDTVGLRLQKVPDFTVQGVEFLLCPINLQPVTVEGPLMLKLRPYPTPRLCPLA